MPWAYLLNNNYNHHHQRLVSTYNSLNLSDYYIYHQVYHSANLSSAHTVYLCVLCGSENKQRLFSYTA